MPTPPLRRAGTSLPASGGGESVGWAAGAGVGVVVEELLSIVTKDLRFLRNRACRSAPVGSFALGRMGGMTASDITSSLIARSRRNGSPPVRCTSPYD